MSFYPEPWKKEKEDDVEIAEDLSAMEALDPQNESADNKSLFRRFWEKLLNNG